MSIVAVLVCAALYTLYQVSAMQAISTKMYRHPMAVSNAVISLDGRSYELQSLLKDAAISRDNQEREAIYQEILVIESLIESDLATIRERYLGSHEPIDAVSEVFNSWPAVRDKVIAVAKKRNRSATQRALKNDLNGWGKAIDPPLHIIRDYAEAKGVTFYESSMASAASAYRWAMGIIISGVIFSWFVSVWTIRSVMKPLGTEPATVRNLVSEIAQGNLTRTIRVAPGDTHSLIYTIGSLRDNLSHLVGVVRSNAESVNTASEEISRGNQELSRRTEQQASSLQKTTTSMQSLKTTVSVSAENAQRANSLAVEASDVAGKGSVVVSQVVETMDQISESSSRISEITGVIDSIAFQTNLLALNAAVEAARAGEQGKGFAVVAAEVRSLAQRSAEAAKQINELISTSVERVEAGSQLVNTAGTTMQQVMGSIHEVTAIMGELSETSGNQSKGVQQVSAEVSDMDAATQQNAALVEESASATNGLRNQAQLLLNAVDQFKLAQ